MGQAVEVDSEIDVGFKLGEKRDCARRSRAFCYSKLPVTPWNPWLACFNSHFITRVTS